MINADLVLPSFWVFKIIWFVSILFRSAGLLQKAFRSAAVVETDFWLKKDSKYVLWSLGSFIKNAEGDPGRRSDGAGRCVCSQRSEALGRVVWEEVLGKEKWQMKKKENWKLKCFQCKNKYMVES